MDPITVQRNINPTEISLLAFPVVVGVRILGANQGVLWSLTDQDILQQVRVTSHCFTHSREVG